MGTCEKCKQTAETGEYYQFYHGYLIDSQTTNFGGGKTIRTTYSIDPLEKVYICDKCMIPKIVNNARSGSILIIAIAIVIIGIVKVMYGNQLPSNISSIIYLSIGSVATLLTLNNIISKIIIPLYFQQKKNQAKIKEIISNKRNWDVGDRFAIEIKKAQSSTLTYKDYFFSREDYNRLQKKK